MANRTAPVLSVHSADFVWRAGGRNARYAEGFQSVYPRTVDEL